jgi:hypothetical protein
MHDGVQSAIYKILLILAYVHVRHSPIDILCHDSFFEFPVIRVCSIEEHNVTLAGGVEQISFRREFASIHATVRTFVSLIILKIMIFPDILLPCLESDPSNISMSLSELCELLSLDATLDPPSLQALLQ